RLQEEQEMDSQHSVCFVTAVNPDDDIQPVRLLLASLREFGGSLKDSPVYVFSPEPGRLEQAAALPGVEVMQLEQPGPAGHYTLVGKVFACARAEALLAGSTDALAWINPDCLVVQPPLLFDLDGRG
ncbi:MAG: hypothetical protein KBG60_07305, partial [Anaerolineaceae bacterium]|nr:hypothetical protein [Anaerolineaceae bacterium]